MSSQGSPANCSTSWFPWQPSFPSQCDFWIGDLVSPSLPSVSPIWRFVLFWLFFLQRKKNILLGVRRRGKGWQSTKQIPSTCLCKLFMLLMHYASCMRHVNQTVLFHVLSPCKQVVIWHGHIHTEFCLAPIHKLFWALSLTEAWSDAFPYWCAYKDEAVILTVYGYYRCVSYATPKVI